MASTKETKETKETKDKPNDLAWAFLGAVLFGVPALIVGSVTTGWANATDWMLDHQVLLPASADPVLALPAAGGAGLDWSRIVIAFGAFAVLSLAVRVVSGAILAGVARHRPTDRRRR